jgi:peptide/nickel transport system substrate-binding protein
VGIETKLNILVAGEYQAAVAAGKYDLVASYLTRGDPVVLQSLLDPRFTNRSALSVNAYAPQTLERVQRLFDAGLQTSASDARAAAYGELQDVLIDENIAFPLYERLWQTVASQRVRGFRWTSEGFALFNDLWLASPAR